MSTATQKTPLLNPSATSKPPITDKVSRFALYYELNRLHKFPVGSILVFWPCAWALTMTAYRSKQDLPNYLWELMLFAVLSTLVHSAACVINDICDRDLDRQVERTKNRPLASGAISVTGAVTCLFVEVGICVGILAYTKDILVFSVGFFGIFPLHGLYPLMKRMTYWPQAWLGLVMNWGFVVVWVLRAKDQDYYAPAVFFAGTICWTIVYDTIYGCQDRVDDVKAGIKSTSLLFGNYVRPILAGFAIGFIAAIAGAGYLNHQGVPYYIISVGGTSIHLTWQLITLRENEPNDCWKKFQSNGNLGYITFAGMLADYLTVVL